MRIKWPNDIYFSRVAKLGGILVESSVFQSVLHAQVGVGLNVSNERPTVSLNGLIDALNVARDSHSHSDRAHPMPAVPVPVPVPHASLESVLASFLRVFERLYTQVPVARVPRPASFPHSRLPALAFTLDPTAAAGSPISYFR